MNQEILRYNNINSKNLLKKNKLLEACILLSIVFSSVKSYGVPIGGIFLSFFKVITLISFCVMALFLFRNPRVRFGKYEKQIAIIVFITILQTLVLPGSLTLSHGMYEIYDYVWILMVLFCLDNSFISPKALIGALLVSLIIPSALGLYQSVVYAITGVVPALPFQIFLDQDEIASSYNVYTRICSCFHDPSYFASVLSSGIVLSFGFIFVYKFERKDKMIKRFSFVVLSASVLPMIMTMSGTGFIALFTGLLVLGISTFSFKRIFKIGFVTFFGLCVLVLFINSTGFDFFTGVFFKLSNQLNNSGGLLYSRLPFYLVGLDAFLSSPLWGVGLGNLDFVGNSIQSSAHCTLLTILSEQGILVFIPTIFLLVVYPIMDLRNVKRRNLRNYQLLLIVYCSYLTIVIQSLGYDLLYKMDYNFCLFLAFVVLQKYVSNSGGEENIL